MGQRVWIKIMLWLLPAPLRRFLMRSRITLGSKTESGLVVKVAQTKEELEGAFRVLHDAYVAQGYCSSQPGGLRVTLHHALPSTSVLIAKSGERVVGTLTLVRDNRLGLPLEKEWKLSRLRVGSQRIAEVTCFAIDPEFRRKNRGTVFFPLLRLMYQYAASYFGTRYLAVVVHPKERDFYEGILLFRSLPGPVVQDYLGAPAIALYLDLEQAPRQFARVYGRKPEHKNLHRYFVGRRPRSVRLPEREPYAVDDPVLDAQGMKYFLFDRSRAGQGASEDQIRAILKYFPGEELTQRACRIEVELRAELHDVRGRIPGEFRITDVSSNGLRLAPGGEEGRIGMGAELRIRVCKGEESFGLVAVVAWTSGVHGTGVRVHPGQVHWLRLVRGLESKLPSCDEVGDLFRKSA